MIALYDFIPKYCPNCGTQIPWDGVVGYVVYDTPKQPSPMKQKFNNHVSMICKCEVRYQLADSWHLTRAAADSDGDLEQYLETQ